MAIGLVPPISPSYDSTWSRKHKSAHPGAPARCLLSWMAINPQERPFRNKQSHHMLWGWLLDSFPQYHLHMTALGLVSTSLPTLGPLLGVPLSWMAINPQERPFRNKQSHHMLWGWLLDSFPQYHLHMTALGLVSTSLPTLGPLLGVPLSWMAINPQERPFRNKQSHHHLHMTAWPRKHKLAHRCPLVTCCGDGYWTRSPNITFI